MLVLAGCGGSGDVDTTSPNRYLLTNEQIASQVSHSSHPGPVNTTLQFWRAIQFQDFALAYSYLAPQLQGRIPYGTFLTKLSEGRGLFLARPRIYNVYPGHGFTTVEVAALQGDILTPSDQIIGFATVQAGDRTLISSDVFNLFHRSYRPDVP